MTLILSCLSIEEFRPFYRFLDFMVRPRLASCPKSRCFARHQQPNDQAKQA